MAEPQPSTVTEGMDDPAPPPTSAEDRKAAAAMNALESRAADNEEAEQKPTKQADPKAIEAALSQLKLLDPAEKKLAEDPNEERRRKKEVEQKEKERKAKIKVDQADVSLLVEELDLTKAKATELLRNHEGDVVKAVRAFVRMWI